MNRFSRPKYETVIVSIVVLLCVVLGISLYAARMRAEKSDLLVKELSMLRSSVLTYKKINRGKNPDSLSTLTTETYKLGENKVPYLEGLPGLKDETSIDPFGSPYFYDKETGWVKSVTKGFEKW